MSDDINPLVALAIIVGALIVWPRSSSKSQPSQEEEPNQEEKRRAEKKEAVARETRRIEREAQEIEQKKRSTEERERRRPDAERAKKSGLDVCEYCFAIEPGRCSCWRNCCHKCTSCNCTSDD